MRRDFAGKIVLVLDRERDPEQRAVVAAIERSLGIVGITQRVGAPDRDEGIQPDVPLDPVDTELDELTHSE